MKIKIPLRLIELEDHNYHLVVNSVFPDATEGIWIVDTGASKTVFHKNLTNYYTALDNEHEELHTTGLSEQALSTTLGILTPVNFGKCVIENLKVALIDLSHLNHIYNNAAGIQLCGLIGSDFLSERKAIIDYQSRQLMLSCKKHISPFRRIFRR